MATDHGKNLGRMETQFIGEDINKAPRYGWFQVSSGWWDESPQRRGTLQCSFAILTLYGIEVGTILPSVFGQLIDWGSCKILERSVSTAFTN